MFKPPAAVRRSLGFLRSRDKHAMLPSLLEQARLTAVAPSAAVEHEV